MVILRHEEDARFLNNYNLKRKVENEGKENLWINPDLTRIEIEAAFEKRKEMTDKKEKQNNLLTIKTTGNRNNKGKSINVNENWNESRKTENLEILYTKIN